MRVEPLAPRGSPYLGDSQRVALFHDQCDSQCYTRRPRRPPNHQWEFQDPKLEVPTLLIRPIQGISSQNMARKCQKYGTVPQYLHFSSRTEDLWDSDGFSRSQIVKTLPRPGGRRWPWTIRGLPCQEWPSFLHRSWEKWVNYDV